MAPKDGMEARSSSLAIVLADSFKQGFRPITLQRPACLMPVLNIPILEYTLEWLAVNEIKEVLVFCCAHAQKIVDYLNKSKWSQDSDFIKVTPVVAQNCYSVGDAMRFIDQLHIVKTDFILVTGDTVTNMKLKPVLDQHKARREKDKNATLTLVTVPGVSVSQRRRLGEVDMISVVDPATDRLVQCVERDHEQWTTGVDVTIFSERDTVEVRTDLMNSQIYVCAPEVLLLFSDNFDYQNMRRDFLYGVLSEEELGNKIYIYEATGEYAVRVQNLRSYDAVSKDVMHRWIYPFVPDTRVLARSDKDNWFKYGRGNLYLDRDLRKPPSSKLNKDVCIGAGASIGKNCTIVRSLIGPKCIIADNVKIVDSYLEEEVSVGNGASITSALVCKKATIHPNATISKGVLLSFNVVIGPDHTVPPYTRVTLCPQPSQEANSSDGELEYSPMADGQPFVDGDLDNFEGPSSLSLKSALLLGSLSPRAADQRAERPQYFDDNIVGRHGAGREWQQSEGFDNRLFSIAPPPKELYTQVSSKAGSDVESDDDDAHSGAGAVDRDAVFEQEVAETFLRCVKKGFDQDKCVIELNSLKIAEVRSFADCAGYVLTTLFLLCMPPPERVKREYRDLFPTEQHDLSSQSGQEKFLGMFRKLLQEWGPLLQRFLRNEDDQVELLFTFEEFYKGEGVFDVPGHWGSELGPLIAHICEIFYEDDVVSEEAFLDWAKEKGNADQEDQEFLEKAGNFITWLQNAEEEDSSEEDDDD